MCVALGWLHKVIKKNNRLYMYKMKWQRKNKIIIHFMRTK
jgi:hypothetical protein